MGQVHTSSACPATASPTAVRMQDTAASHAAGVGLPNSISAGVSPVVELPPWAAGAKRAIAPESIAGATDRYDLSIWPVIGRSTADEPSSLIARSIGRLSPITSGTHSPGNPGESNALTMISGPTPQGSPIVIATIGCVFDPSRVLSVCLGILTYAWCESGIEIKTEFYHF